MFRINKIKINNVALFLILIVAVFLRIYKIKSIPFTFDEYSALFRTQFNNIHELIQFGVIGDGHPAGIQIGIYYLVKLFGFNEFWLKLPFVLFGIVSVFYTYKIGKLWFNESVGLFSAAFIATLKFSVMYSQIARPYMSGLFFSLFMIYHWSRYIFFSNKTIDKYLFGFILGAVLCAYNHYFSLLLAIITGFTGLFYISKNKITNYILSGLLIFILFTPHLNITLLVLEIKGLSWLGRPSIFFFTEYIKFIFNSSVFIGLLTIIIILISYFNRNTCPEKNKFRVISIVLFILPLIIGITYSVYVKPVVQFSVLIFSFPFFIILVFSWMKELNAKKNLLINILIVFVISSSLIFEKKHYTIFYQSGFLEILKENSKILQEYDSKNVTSIILSSKNITNYLLKKDTALYNSEIRNSITNKLDKHEHYLFRLGWNKIDSISCFNDTISIKDYRNFLDSQNTDYLFFGWAHHFDSKILDIITNYYPYLVASKNFYNSETYLFSKIQPKNHTSLEYHFKSQNNFEEETTLWSKCKNITDSIFYEGKYSCFIPKEAEYSTTFKTRYNSIFNNNSECIHASVKFYSPNIDCNAYLVFSIENNHKTIEWHYANLQDFIDPRLKWQTAHLIVQPNKIHFPYNKKVKVYIWNLKQEEFYIDNFSVQIYPGNKNRFSY